MHHDVVDLKKWIQMFPLGTLRDEAKDYVLNRQKENPSYYPTKKSVTDHIALMQPGGEMITSPIHIAVVEQIRAEVFGKSVPDDRIATDNFVFSKGEPVRREITKVGGLPFWPKDARWPKRNGKPLIFVAQFCFMDSKDIIGALPGHILLIFADEDSINDQDAIGFHFEWMRFSESELVSKSDIPESEFTIPPCYGSILRTFDFPSSEEMFSKYKQPYLLPVIEGTKIGGVPRWIQGEEELPGRFLCALGSIHPKKGKPYPFLNSLKPISSNDFSDHGLMWGDVGSVYFFVETKGSVRAAIQCY